MIIDMKLYEYIDKCLIEFGIEKVFGVPGSLVMPIWQGITRAEIILCSHEQEASYLATGYSKISRKPAVVITTGGPGVTNCISGIASANIDSIPLIYISGRTALRENGYGQKQEESSFNRMFDSVDVMSNFTKKSVCITDEYTAANEIKNTMHRAISGRQGAVHISIPIDMQKIEIKDSKLINVSDTNKCSEKISFKKFSRRPLFIIGWGTWMANSFGEIYELAEKINAPVVVTSKAYCCIDVNSPMYVGKIGYGNNPMIENFLNFYNPDSIYAFGTSLGIKDIEGCIVSDLIKKVDTYVITNEYTMKKKPEDRLKVLLKPDMKKFVTMLCDMEAERKKDNNLQKAILDIRGEIKEYWKSKIDEKDTMAKVTHILTDKCNENMVVTADAGNHLANVGAIFTPKESGGLFLDVGLRAMGTGICTTVGMAIANNEKTYLAITGDGCMLMNGNVLHVAKEQDLPVIFILFNNNSLGRVRIGQSVMNDFRASDIKNVDFQHYGRAFGLETYLFTEIDEFEANIDSIICKRKTCLVEFVTNRDEIPLSVKGNVF